MVTEIKKQRNGLIFSLIIFSIFLISFVSATQIPYDGLTLNWKGEYSFKNNDFSSANHKEDLDYLYIYSNPKEGKITQKAVNEDKEEIIDIESRELITGEDIGNKTSQWINVNVTIGDKIQILGADYVVKSTSDKIYIRDFGNMKTIKVESTQSLNEVIIEDNEKYQNLKVSSLIWYDSITGLKLKFKTTTIYDHIFTFEYLGETSYSKEEISEYELRENNVDNDKDGLTDLEELFEYQTNPLLRDSDADGLEDLKEIEMGLEPTHENTDGDWWIDGKDSNPLSKAVPLIYYIIGIIVVGGLVGGFFWMRKKKTKKKK